MPKLINLVVILLVVFKNVSGKVVFSMFLYYLCMRYISKFFKRKMLFPDYIFETSWEVCNKVGGIYTVLSTRAKTLQDRMKDHVIFLGPDCWYESQSPYFKQDDNLFADWQQKALSDGLKVKVGRWDIQGRTNPLHLLTSGGLCS